VSRNTALSTEIPLKVLTDSANPSPLLDLGEALTGAERSLEAALAQGAETFVLTYSGGKDSTATAVLTLEWWKRRGKPVEVHVVYADTGLEIPTLHAQALGFLEAVKSLHPEVGIHIAKPRPEESFWVQLIGKGYPPPHNRFRWCTRRLKIAPMDRLVQSLPGKKAILTGVRFGESDARDSRLLLSCSRGGECGQGVMFEEAKRLNALYVAPIAFWRECFVWDYLNLVAPFLGYPTGALEGVYGSRDTRFGCWTCTVVRRDKAMARALENGHAHLRPLYEFREWLWSWTRDPGTRVKRKDGNPGRLTLEARREVYRRLKEVEERVGVKLMTPEEEALIRESWGSINGGPWTR
jgi:DNA sulfur modification protein DndC